MDNVSTRGCTTAALRVLPVLHLSNLLQVNTPHLVIAEYDMEKVSGVSIRNAMGWEEEHSSTKLFASGGFMSTYSPWKTNLKFVEKILPTKESRTACIIRGKFVNWTKWDFHLCQECFWHNATGKTTGFLNWAVSKCFSVKAINMLTIIAIIWSLSQLHLSIVPVAIKIRTG